MRDFPKYIKNIVNNSGDYVRKLIAISNEPDYRKFYSIDDKLIDEIEDINIDPNTPNYENLIVTTIIDRINKMKMYPSNIALIERCFGRIAYNRTIQNRLIKNGGEEVEKINPEYEEKQADRFVCGNIYSIRCFVIDNSDGTKMFYHNQPEISISGEQGKISKLTTSKKNKEKNNFRIFYIQSGKPMWRNANVDESIKLHENSSMDINNRISSKLSKIVPVQMQDGSIQNVEFNSIYYISYYEGTYRLTNRTKGTGEDLTSLKNPTLQTCLSWLEKTPIIYLPGNYQMLVTLKTLITGNSTKKKDRNDLVIKFFRDNDLIFFFSIEEIIHRN